MRTFRKNYELLLLCLPALAAYIIFSYVPMIGLVLPFKNYKYAKGLFGSDWYGLKNFQFLFRSIDFKRITVNTVSYGVLFMAAGSVMNILFALLLFEIKNIRASLKVYQTIMTFPNFMSWVIVGFITYALLNPSLGVLIQILRFFNPDATLDVYVNAGYWPFILTFVNVWKGLGIGSMMYLAALLAVDPELYEAATIDGASRLQQVRHISLPHIIPLWTILTIMGAGSLFRGDLGLFFQIPRDVSVLYPTTDIIETYIYRALKDPRSMNWQIGAATGLVQSVVGLFFVGITNYIVSKISPENAMF